MRRARDLGLHEKVYLLVGVGPLRSERAAEFMRSRVPGVHIPDAVVDRLAKTPRKGKREEGIRICVEIIEEVKQIEGVRGVHIMAYRAGRGCAGDRGAGGDQKGETEGIAFFVVSLAQELPVSVALFFF